MRCALTGEPIRPDSLIYVIRSPVRQTRRRYLEADYDTVTAPLTLHKSAWHTGAEGVGLFFTAQWSAYLQASLRELGFKEHLELSVWWDSDYGIQRVRLALLECLPTHVAVKTLTAVLAIHRDAQLPVDVCAAYGVSEDWLQRKVAWCMQLAHRKASSPVRRTAFATRTA